MFLIMLSATACAGTIYVSGDGSGDYKCDGTDDQVEINLALQYAATNPGTIVHLKGPFTYTISQPLAIGSNTILQGDSTTVLKLANNVGWNAWTPMIKQLAGSQSNITVRGFSVNVNQVGNDAIPAGKGYHNVIQLEFCDNINVNNMIMYDGAGDGLRATNCSNVSFYNNRIYNLGHDGLFAIRSENVEAWNNNISCKTNSGLRIWNTNHVGFHDNVINAGAWCGPGIQIEKSSGNSMNDVRVYNNTIYGVYGPAIWLIGYDQPYMARNEDSTLIYHNLFYGNGRHTTINWVGGVVVDGFSNVLIYENIFDHNRGAAVLGMKVESAYIPQSNNCNVTVKDNIITNTIPAGYSANSGYAIENQLGSHCDFVIDGNCIYNNTAGAYRNIDASATDIYVDPLYMDEENKDFRLQATSPMTKLIGVPIGFQGFVMGDTGFATAIAGIDFTDSALIEATTQDVYNYSIYLNGEYAGQYKDITKYVIGNETSKLQYNSPVISLLTAYASANKDANLSVTDYTPYVTTSNDSNDSDNSCSNSNSKSKAVDCGITDGDVVYYMNNATNSNITNYNDCVVNNINNITTINNDSHNVDSHDVYYQNNTTINIYYQNNTTIIYYGTPT